MNRNKELQEMQAREATVNAEEKISSDLSQDAETRQDAKEVAVSEKQAILNINKGYSEAVKDEAAAQDDMLSSEDRGHLEKDGKSASGKAHASDDATEDDAAGVISSAAQERKKKGVQMSPGQKAAQVSAARLLLKKRVEDCEKVEESSGKSCEALREQLAEVTEEMRSAVAFASAEKGAADREQQAAHAAMVAEKANGNEGMAEALERVAEAKARKARELDSESESAKGAGKEDTSGYKIAAPTNGTKLNEKAIEAEEAQDEAEEKKQNDAQTRLNVNVKKIKDKMKKVDADAATKMNKAKKSSLAATTSASGATGSSGGSGMSGATGAKGPLEEGDDDDLPRSAEELRKSKKNQANVRKEIELALQRIRDAHGKDTAHVHEAAARVKKVRTSKNVACTRDSSVCVYVSEYFLP